MLARALGETRGDCRNVHKGNKKMRNLVGVILLSLSATAVAHAAVRAPELDPASAVAALTLMSGGLAVLRGRRTKR